MATQPPGPNFIPKTPDSDTARKFSDAAWLMQMALSISTALTDLSQKIVIYWTLATHSLPHQRIFPLLELLGIWELERVRPCGLFTILRITRSALVSVV